MASSNRTDTIIDVVREAFAPLMRADPVAFRAKYRKMALDPHAFYRGSACLFYNDVTQDKPRTWAGHGAERIWIHGDLHVENFGDLPQLRRPSRLRHQRLRRGLPRPLHAGTCSASRPAWR